MTLCTILRYTGRDMSPLLPVEQHKTKIIATIGPSSWDERIFRKMVEAGLDIARINASFADTKEIRRVTAMVRRIAPHVAVLLDTNGHKIRLNDFGAERKISSGQEVTLFTRPVQNQISLVTDSKLGLEKQIPVGSILLIDDGIIKIEVRKVDGYALVCKVLQGGTLKRLKTVAIPGVTINFGGISSKDRQDIETAKAIGIDMVALSFVRTADDVEVVRKMLGKSNVALVAKIEDQLGVENFESILDVSEGIMVARGDLGLEVQPERVPVLQKQFIRDCNIIGKPVVVATQMLQSMVTTVVPTRAEVSDVANAIFDGADAIMLSAETATGLYPAESVSMMSRICREVEAVIEPRDMPSSPLAKPTTNAIAQAVFETCLQLPVDKIIVATGSGCTAQTISRFWLKQPIYAFTRDHTSKMRLTLSRGIVPHVMSRLEENSSVAVRSMVKLAKKRGYVQDSDLLVVVAGANVIQQGGTNVLEINTVSQLIS